LFFGAAETVVENAEDTPTATANAAARTTALRGRPPIFTPYSPTARPRRARELLGFHQGAELRELLGAQLVALAAIETV